MEVASYLFLLFLIFLLFTFALFIGIIVGMFVRVYEFISPAISYITRVIYFSSGIFFMLQELPDSLKNFLLFSPIVQIVDLARGIMVSDYTSAGASIGYILCCLFVLISIACITYMSLREKVLIAK